ncbi:MAG: hypothetical protein HOV80_32645 [Polyangiaceae bacterium]|nr:hypothetical protein [Polyangiaceae bacterium]
MPTDELMEHINEPRNFKSKVEGEQTFKHMATDMRAGDVATIVLGLDAEGTVVDAGFKAMGSGLLLGVLSWLTDWAKGKSLQELEQAEALPLESQFDLDLIGQRSAGFAKQAMAEAAQVAKRGLGTLSPDDVLADVISRLEIFPESFDASSFAEELDREREELTTLGYTFDGPRLLTGLLAEMHAVSSTEVSGYEEALALCNHFDGGLRERVGGELLRVFEERGLIPQKAGA